MHSMLVPYFMKRVTLRASWSPQQQQCSNTLHSMQKALARFELALQESES
jgi:hypothetical protein